MKKIFSAAALCLLMAWSCPASAYTPIPQDVGGTGATAFSPTTFVCDGTDQTSPIQNLLSVSGSYRFIGTCKTGALFVSGVNVTIDFAPGAVLQPTVAVNKFWNFTNSNVTFKNFTLDGQYLAQVGVYLTNGTFNSPGSTISISNLGSTTTVATDLIAGIAFYGTTNIQVGSAVFSGFGVYGNGLCNTANNIGVVRGLWFYNTGYADIKYFEWSGGSVAGDNGEQIDALQANTGNAGGYIHRMVVKYNGNTRRALKIQSGNWTIGSAELVKGADFVPITGQNIGSLNLNAFDWASTLGGKLTILSGHLDCTGFPICVSNSGGGGGASSVHMESGMELTGAKVTQTRSSTICNGALSNYSPVGFYGASTGNNDGVIGATFYGFAMPISLQGNNAYSLGARYIDPLGELQIGSSTQTAGAQFSDNIIITQTTGYLAGTQVVHFYNNLNITASNNTLVSQGNTPAATYFLRFTDTNATGFATNNIAPSGITGTSSVTSNISFGQGTFNSPLSGKPLNIVNSSPSVSTSTITVDNSASNDLEWIFAHANSPYIITSPTSTPGTGVTQDICLQMRQSMTGGETISIWGSAYDFGTLGVPTLSAGANKTDMFCFRYNKFSARWNLLSETLGL